MAKAFVVIDGGNFYHKLKAKQVGISNRLKFNYKKFVLWLAKRDRIVDCCYYVGQIREEAGNEKGVDVRIAVDICMKATRNEYDRLILISSDTDLVPAIKEVQNLGKHVEYVGFDFNPSFAMIRFSDSRTLLKRGSLIPFNKIRRRKK